MEIYGFDLTLIHGMKKTWDLDLVVKEILVTGPVGFVLITPALWHHVNFHLIKTTLWHCKWNTQIINWN